MAMMMGEGGGRERGGCERGCERRGERGCERGCERGVSHPGVLFKLSSAACVSG
jgi:hypothetical protein